MSSPFANGKLIYWVMGGLLSLVLLLGGLAVQSVNGRLDRIDARVEKAQDATTTRLDRIDAKVELVQERYYLIDAIDRRLKDLYDRLFNQPEFFP